MITTALKFEHKRVFNTIKIQQKSGKLRIVNNPVADLKPILKQFNKETTQYYHDLLMLNGLNEIPHAYLPRKSIKTNAQVHKNAPKIIKFDFAHFFDDVRFEYVEEHLFKLIPGMTHDNKHIVEHLLINPKTKGVIQGAPPSGALAGLALIPFWQELRRSLPRDIVFTQYSDDLIFSTESETNDVFTIGQITKKIEKALVKSKLNFTINAEKTKTQTRHFRRITGVSVNDKNQCTPSVKNHRWLRSFAHMLRKNQDIVETLAHFNTEIDIVNGKIAYMHSIDETAKISALLAKHHDLFNRFGVYTGS